MSPVILEVEKLTKIFYPALSFTDLAKFNFGRKKPVTALNNISFSLNKGKILGILGPNGAGKTTLLKIISSLIVPDKGEITLGQYTAGKNDNEIKSIIGLASCEERSFYWRLTGNQNLQFFAALYGLNKKQTESRIQELLDIFSIGYQDKRFYSYSTGMKRKFALMRALLHNPEILLLDEPTKSLDYNSACELRKLIKTIANEGKTIIIATHNMNEAQELCDLFMILKKGNIYGLGPLKELSKKTGSQSLGLTDIYLKLTER